MRRFLRHPAGIPIELVAAGDDRSPLAPPGPAVDVSVGGLAFHFPRPLEHGALMKVRIPSVSPVFESIARVVWCLLDASGYRVGVEFLDAEDEFRARMVEQVCHIESYRQRVRTDEHRDISAEEAAREWIVKFAERFTQANSEDVQ